MKAIKLGVILLCITLLIAGCGKQNVVYEQEIIRETVPAHLTTTEAPPVRAGNSYGHLEDWSVRLLEWGTRANLKLEQIGADYGYAAPIDTFTPPEEKPWWKVW